MAEANINLIGSEDMPSPSEIWFESFDKYGLMWWHVFYQCFRMTPGTETADNPLDHGLAVAGGGRYDAPLSQSPFYYFMDRSQ